MVPDGCIHFKRFNALLWRAWLQLQINILTLLAPNNNKRKKWPNIKAIVHCKILFSVSITHPKMSLTEDFFFPSSFSPPKVGNWVMGRGVQSSRYLYLYLYLLRGGSICIRVKFKIGIKITTLLLLCKCKYSLIIHYNNYG